MATLGVKKMEITVIESTEDHISHGAINTSVTMFDVLQGSVLIGVYHRECDALKYKQLLESDALEILNHGNDETLHR